VPEQEKLRKRNFSTGEFPHQARHEMALHHHDDRCQRADLVSIK
jgi:hypothetical protein